MMQNPRGSPRDRLLAHPEEPLKPVSETLQGTKPGEFAAQSAHAHHASRRTDVCQVTDLNFFSGSHPLHFPTLLWR
jgi:hypothetical protein